MISSKQYRFRPSASLAKTVTLRQFIRQNANYEIDEDILLNLDLNDLEEAAYNVIVDAGMNTHAMTCNDNFSDEKPPNIFRDDDPFNLAEYNLRPVESME